MIRSLAVFCGSKSGVNPLYEAHATELGHIMAEHGVELIYGAGNKGIMGAVANAVLAKSGRVTGIIPQLLIEWEQQHTGLTELIVVDDMHTRKKLLYEKCDAAIILPGGFGTLDELYEMLTWNQLNIHSKEIYILNTAGFYDALILHMHKMQDEQFLYDIVEDRITVIATPAELVAYL
jgi:uncharacterized protein (TIGR00730 family)